MSNWAMGWAQRQQVGCPVAKAVLGTMCFLMHDESLLAYPGIPTLCEYTEYDDRTIRKAIQRLADAGVLYDTGLKKNNVTVWRVPGYENWLRRQIESPDKNGRASETDIRALAQVVELTKEKTAAAAANRKPSQKREGGAQAPPNLQPSPPIFAPDTPQALPKMGANLSGDLHRSSGSADERANPSGSHAAQDRKPEPERVDAKGNPFNAQMSRQTWFTFVHNAIVTGAIADGIAGYGTVRINDLPHQARVFLAPVLNELTEWAIAEERSGFPEFTAKSRKGVEEEIEARIRRELKPLRAPSPGKRAA